MFSEEPAPFSFTPSEIHQLLSFFESGLPVHSPSGSETGPSRTVYSVEERKKRRMLSNRESARRSRWRKKRHLENLTSQVNHSRLENRELKNLLCLASHQCLVAKRETDRLMTESLLLQQRLSGLCQILANMHLL
ncbi:BZIP transcription factor [Actinidia chinensis var. chinensis]|uniref:BZIP transcription factor n=1 Tax=Actinidia chinensis var. chinensis TaxID=1590841 RepID=A0A2R6Q0M9_ACTCC|nr:BZIP transcription factor [Actinidia chinensis var. chinensis]